MLCPNCQARTATLICENCGYDLMMYAGMRAQPIGVLMPLEMRHPPCCPPRAAMDILRGKEVLYDARE